MSKKKKSKGIVGIFKSTEKKFGFVEIEGEEDVFIPSEFASKALDGDTVRIKIIKPKQKDRKAEGKIEKVLNRNVVTVIRIIPKK